MEELGCTNRNATTCFLSWREPTRRPPADKTSSQIDFTSWHAWLRRCCRQQRRRGGGHEVPEPSCPPPALPAQPPLPPLWALQQRAPTAQPPLSLPRALQQRAPPQRATLLPRPRAPQQTLSAAEAGWQQSVQGAQTTQTTLQGAQTTVSQACCQKNNCILFGGAGAAAASGWSEGASTAAASGSAASGVSAASAAGCCSMDVSGSLPSFSSAAFAG